MAVNDVNVKPSRMVKVGDKVSVRKPPVTYSFRILKTIEQRVGAKLLPEIYENVTTPDQYELLEMNRISGFVDRQRGTGRPTKKDRRAMDAFVGPSTPDEGSRQPIYALGVHFEQNTTRQGRLAQFTIYDTKHPSEATPRGSTCSTPPVATAPLARLPLVKDIKSSDGWKVTHQL